MSGGTDTHLVLVDLSPKGINGKELTEALDSVHITVNKNSIPFDPLPPSKTSGVRLGSPAGTSRGFKEAEFEIIANVIADVIEALHSDKEQEVLEKSKKTILELTNNFPIYKD